LNIFSKRRNREKRDNYWSKRGYILTDYPFDDFPEGSMVLDVGCGSGNLLETLSSKGVHGIGVDECFKLVKSCKKKGLTVVLAKAETLPFSESSFGGVICKVTLPYTDEAVVMENIAKVISPGVRVHLCCHGIGYYVHYLFFSHSFLTRIYSLLTIINTCLYILRGKRWRDTIYQSRSRLMKYFKTAGLEIEKFFPSKTFLRLPVFMYFRLRKIYKS
jgi:SAM-dependent methyltransferase